MRVLFANMECLASSDEKLSSVPNSNVDYFAFSLNDHVSHEHEGKRFRCNLCQECFKFKHIYQEHKVSKGDFE